MSKLCSILSSRGSNQSWVLEGHGHALDAAGGKCFYKAEDWWRYEVCYNKHVKQFHSEGETTVDEYSLGQFDEAATNLNDIKVSHPSIARLSNHAALALSGMTGWDHQASYMLSVISSST